MAVTNLNNYTQITRTLHPSDMLVSNSVRATIINILFVGAGSVTSLFGIIANIINIVVYVKHGVKDSATVQFLSLSASDCAFSILAFMSSVSVFVSRVRPYLTLLDPVSFSYCVAITREKVYSTSVMIIFIMSIERCFCVAFPFSVKRIFSKSRSIKAVICISVIFMASQIPEYLTVGLVWTYDRTVNKSRLMIWISRDKPFTDVWKNIILAGVLPVVSGITTTMCTAYMIAAIKASNKLRQLNVTGQRLNSSLKKTQVSNGVQSSNEKHGNMGKDARLTRTVISVAIIFIICNIPKCIVIASSIVGQFIPDFSILVSGKYSNLVSILYTITFVFEAINCASNFLIYYVCSRKFKTTVDHAFRK